MGGKTSILAGLLAGVIVGGVIVGAAFALLPPLPTPALPTPTPAPTAPPTPVITPSPSVSPGLSGSPGPSVAPGPSGAPAASGSTGSLFGIGQAAPALSLSRVGGGTIDLQALRGKPVWVNFMATWCPSCRDELPIMNGFVARYAKDGLEMVIVDVKEPAADVGAYMASLGVKLPVGLDSNGSAAAAWKAVALPVHFWVDKDGIVRAGAVGSVGPDLMAKNLQAILPGVTVTP